MVHLTGKGKSENISRNGYKSFEFVKDELPHIFAAADLVVSRAGANSLFEFLVLKKPMLLSPLEIGSRGDQVLNANSFKKQGWADILSESKLEGKVLLEAIDWTYERREDQLKAMNEKEQYLYTPTMLAADLLS